MKLTHVLRRIAGAAAAAVALGLLTFTTAPSASAATGTSAATLAAANVGKTAGTCANTPTYNSLGGSQFEHSCAGGYSGGPEYWCADFVQWVWGNSGFYTGGLTAAAASFQTYGQNNGTLHTSASYSPQPGDAVVYGSVHDTEIHHVGIVTAVNSDGSITTANGDWNGTPGAGSMAEYAVSSKVVSVTISASEKAVGKQPSNVDPADGYYIVGYTTPTTSGSGDNPLPGNPYGPRAVCGTGFGVIDSHDLGGATVFLLYNASSGSNCVVTLAANPAGAVAMNATLSVQGGASLGNPGSFTYYAGPVTLPAAGACVKWGGSFKSTSWTSAWSHCG
ncbi:CHAP domain-containing protein [Kitasatospora atroaurantiaca]|uniref:CHAP domain-containing protein n=1 Tax=Kitasatospora atroaurantiaca TaxID=285545 RepID=A0A561EXP8_9ACTN|nr:CHAP domain-containing protein [Kitasatospora atroaurantiaca]TWE20383.1 CHAP domain-containing protein [Kitasatospora atroaurantiaca]